MKASKLRPFLVILASLHDYLNMNFVLGLGDCFILSWESSEYPSQWKLVHSVHWFLRQTCKKEKRLSNIERFN